MAGRLMIPIPLNMLTDLILENPEYVRLHGKWELTLQMELQLLTR